MTEPHDIAWACLATHARRAARALTRRYDRALEPFDLRVTQFSVLVAASLADEEVSITDLADVLGLERSGLSRNLGPLVRRGLIALGPESRHRARRVGLTDEGARLLAAATPAWEAVQAETAAALPAAPAEVVATLRSLSTT